VISSIWIDVNFGPTLRFCEVPPEWPHLIKASEIELYKREQSCSFVVTRTRFKERRLRTVPLVHGRNRLLRCEKLGRHRQRTPFVRRFSEESVETVWGLPGGVDSL
jgi:hypothetical protein